MKEGGGSHKNVHPFDDFLASKKAPSGFSLSLCSNSTTFGFKGEESKDLRKALNSALLQFTLFKSQMKKAECNLFLIA